MNGSLPTVRTFVSVVSFVVMMFGAWPARAELVFFQSGRSLSVKGHRIEGDALVLTLRGGGEVSSQPDAAALSPYAEIIDTAAANQGVDAKLVRAVIQVESAYRASARSRKGAMGLMQLMPDTARRYQVAN